MYSTSLTDSQWEVIKVYLPLQRKRKYDLPDIVNRISYLLKTGCQWRLLPNDFPPYRLVHYYFRSWSKRRLWHKLNRELNGLYRQKQGRKPSPSVAIVDSQSVKNSEWGLPDKGFDGHNRIKGRKRHLAVDTLGLVLSVSLSAANIHDSVAATGLLKNLEAAEYESLDKILANSAYKGELVDWCKEEFGWQMEIATAVRGNQKGFEPVPQRWKVERTISWIQWDRRLAKDYEANLDAAEAFVLISNSMRVIKKILDRLLIMRKSRLITALMGLLERLLL